MVGHDVEARTTTRSVLLELSIAFKWASRERESKITSGQGSERGVPDYVIQSNIAFKLMQLIRIDHTYSESILGRHVQRTPFSYENTIFNAEPSLF